MRKGAIIFTITSILLLIALEIILRVMGREPAHKDEYDHLLNVNPNEFIKSDTLLGWTLGVGHFYFSFNDEKPFFQCIVVAGHERYIPHDISLLPGRKKIQLYGCSYTFGFSVADTQQVGYYLQQLLPEYKVQNKAVPGYNLAQMYLALIRTVSNGDTPNIAMLNYCRFHDDRSPLCDKWCRMLRFAMEQARERDYTGFSYPYISGDTIALLPYREFPQDWPWRERSALIDLLNASYDRWHDGGQAALLFQSTATTLRLFSEYCAAHHIRLIVTVLDDNTEKAIAGLPGIQAHIIDYHVNIADTAFNCSPIDPGHPNARAQRIFAQKIAEEVRK